MDRTGLRIVSLNGLMDAPNRLIVNLALVVWLVLLAGCAARYPAPIYDRDGNASRTNPARHQTTRVRPATYIVRKGDTLYGIAWRYSLDFRQIAAWNDLQTPFTIYPQQKLFLMPPAQRRVQVAATGPRSTTPAPQRRTDPPVVSRVPPRESTPVERKPPAKVPVKRPIPESPPAQEPQRNSPKDEPQPAATEVANADVRWRWPTDGQIRTTFAASDPSRKGIDIVGNQGQTIKAAAAGQVVYSGAGLIGYGELVIIKHNQRFLSAYGHNRKRLVAEGDSVVAGQKIAEMGNSGADRSMLHFEIRRDGEPVNPQAYLPRR